MTKSAPQYCPRVRIYREEVSEVSVSSHCPGNCSATITITALRVAVSTIHYFALHSYLNCSTGQAVVAVGVV